MTEESNRDQLKPTLMADFDFRLKYLAKMLAEIPMHPTHRLYVNMNFDQFVFWVNQAFAMMPENLNEAQSSNPSNLEMNEVDAS